MNKTAALLTVTLLLASTQALAGWRGDSWHQAQRWEDSTVTHRDLETERHSTSLEQAVEMVRRQTGGRILSATTEVRHGHGMHRIKVLTRDRQVQIFEVPADE